MHFTLQSSIGKEGGCNFKFAWANGRIDGLAHCKPFQAVLMALPSIVAGEYGEVDSVIKIGFFLRVVWVLILIMPTVMSCNIAATQW